MSEWSVTEPQKLTFDTRVSDLQVRIVNGTVNVVGTDEGSARLEVTEIQGPPLMVTQNGDTLTVAYDDLPWKGFLKWLDRKGWQRSAVVSLAVPADTRVEVGVVGATAVVSGIDGPAVIKGVTGDTTLVGVSGPVTADTVSGNVEAQAVTGDLRFKSVSGDLTVVEGSGRSVRADSVSGSMIVDLDPDGPTEVGLTSVSGEIAIRLPHPADAEVEANTASGTISNAFDGLRVHGQWGAHKITGRLGAGTGRLRATTVSGSIALLRRPPREDEPDTPWDTKPSAPSPAASTDPSGTSGTSGSSGPSGPSGSSGPSGPSGSSGSSGSSFEASAPPQAPGTAPAADAPAAPGDNSVSDQGAGTSDTTDAPADGTTEKKVL
ncbi:DUF4097 family beta strand repeat-containing protein [Streptomyces alanosinicus]|uniref:DUF4097 domain-containing protein n=1 Tax=Streptomyces alanosinicus TaxID=68171 RepID=A0A918YIZ2_9ACTN|nr:DUF4097 family beta strand repeat-containing protein [Streptomyces alanosinicus]GHE04770.1 hypothetical protein GCM10010339_37810 [Streptomyces alanosinicus]